LTAHHGGVHKIVYCSWEGYLLATESALYIASVKLKVYRDDCSCFDARRNVLVSAMRSFAMNAFLYQQAVG
jgi:hypothetical protein